MKVKKRQANEYWVEGVPAYAVEDEVYTDVGPYETKDEAVQVMRGMQFVFDELAKG